MNTINDQNPERDARMSLEKKLADMTGAYHSVLIDGALEQAARAAGGPTETVKTILRGNSQVALDETGKPRVLVVSPAGTMSPMQAVNGLKSSEEFGFLWQSVQQSAPPDLSDLSDPTKYRAIRASNPELLGLGTGQRSKRSR